MTTTAQRAAPLPIPTAHESLAGVAHDLRLPLSHIKGYVSSLRRDDLVWDDDTRGEFLAEIEQEVDRLAQMVDSLLHTQAARSRARPETNTAFIDPAAVIKRALRCTQTLFGGRPLRVDIAPDLPWVRVDVYQLERVLTNLLQNAVKYSPPGSPIGVRACTHGDYEVELSVEDEGPGISPGERARIFEPFFRNQKARQSGVSGHGLGLAICQSIVLAAGGRMSVTDRLGGGSTFSVYIPLQAPAVTSKAHYSAGGKRK